MYSETSRTGVIRKVICDDKQRVSDIAQWPTDRLASALKGALKMPILLDEFDFRLDDEFVRRFGGSVLGLLALGQPGIKQYMTFKEGPIDRPKEE